jgi:omega-amidase
MDLKITTLQLDLVWENKVANFEKIDEILRGSLKTDVIVLPEMFTTGFSMTPEKLAEPMFSETFNWMKAKAFEYDAVITGSFICAENGQYFNRLIWMQPDGVFFKYDKRHRFSLAGENHHYTEGVERITVEWRGWRICPLICYDLRFPVWSRNAPAFQTDDLRKVKNETIQNTPYYYDVLIYVANWPAIRAHPWKSLLVARAIENQSYVIGVNRVGLDGNQIAHSGDSAIIDFQGGTIFAITEKEDISTTILNRGDLVKFRNKFGFLEDQDSFKINVEK